MIMRMRMNPGHRKSLKKRKTVAIHESRNELCVFDGQEPPSNIDQPSSLFIKNQVGKGILKKVKKTPTTRRNMIFR